MKFLGCKFQNCFFSIPPGSLLVSQHRSCTCNAILSFRTGTLSHNAHIATKQYTFIIICIQTSVRSPPKLLPWQLWGIFLGGHDNRWCTSGVAGGFLFRRLAGGLCLGICVGWMCVLWTSFAHLWLRATVFPCAQGRCGFSSVAVCLEGF